MTELLKCPFCGEPVTMRYSSLAKQFIVEHKVFNRFCIMTDIKFKEASLASATKAWNRRAEPDNPPLTEEQIRGMVGKPVFVDYNLTGTKEWAIIKSVSDMKIWFSDGMYIWLNDIDKTVDIYAHEPKKDGAE